MQALSKPHLKHIVTLKLSIFFKNEEIKTNVYFKWLTSDSSIQILKKENELLKTAQNNCYGKNGHETNDFREVVINSQRQVMGKLGHVAQVHVCRKRDFISLYKLKVFLNN